MSSLAQAFLAASPRTSSLATPWRSAFIHGCVLASWLLLIAAIFCLPGVYAWAIGMVYLLYDTALLAFTFAATQNIARQPLAPALAPAVSSAVGTAARLGVIVAAHNEAVVLPATIAALLAQSQKPDQIIVVDDGSSDGTDELLMGCYGLTSAPLGELSEASPQVPTLHWLRLPHGGKARALNAAILRTDVDTVLTVDADTLLEPDALAAIRQAFAHDSKLVAATGVLRPVCGPGSAARVLQWFQTYEYIRNFLSRYAWMRADGLLLISGAFAGFRRAAVVKVGGFDPNCLVEDYELIHRLRRYAAQQGLGWTTRVLGQARARTEAPGSLPAFVRQRRRWFGGFLQTQFWYRDMVGNPRYGAVGTRMLPVKAIDTMQPLFGLTAALALLGQLASGQLHVLSAIAAVVLIKIGIDLAYQAWSIRAYQRWVGEQVGVTLKHALLAAVLEPFSFQILRHAAAVYGWAYFLTGRMRWGRQQRAAAC